MNIASAVATGLLAAFALAAVALCFGYPIGRLSTLWQSISTEEQARFGLLTAARRQMFGRLIFGLWMARAVAATAADFLPRWGMRWPAATFFRSPLAVAFGFTFYSLLLIFPLLWSWRVLRLPPDGCSVALRQLARWTFPLCAMTLALSGLLLFWTAHVPN